MAYARIELVEVCSEEQKKRLVEQLTQTISESIAVPESRVMVCLKDSAGFLTFSTQVAHG